MKKMATKVKLTAMAGLLGVMACVGAAPANAAMVTVNKGTYDFAYDPTFWGIGLGTTFNAATLTFSDMGYQASTLGNKKGWTYSSYGDYGSPVAMVTPHAGYKLVDVTSGFTGTYDVMAGPASGASAWESSGIYSLWRDAGWLYAGASSASQSSSTPPAASGSYDQFGVAPLGGATTPVYLDYTLSGGAHAYGAGSFAAVSHDTSYFSVNVAPVPEPETWAMMMIGVTLVGFQLRKKNKETSSPVMKGMA